MTASPAILNDCQNLEDEVRKEEVYDRMVNSYVEKCAEDFTKRHNFADEMKKEYVSYVFITPDFSKDCLTIYCLKSGQEDVREIIQDKIDAKKEKLIKSVTKFDYPKRHGGLQVSLKPGGEVDCISPAPSSNDIVSLDVLACSEDRPDKDAFRLYGDLEHMEAESTMKITKQNTHYLWGKLHCKSTEMAERAIRVCNRQGFPFCLFKDIQLSWPRPELNANSTGVKYIRVMMKQMVRKVKQVNLHLHDKKWQPNKQFFMLGKEHCKVKWFGDGTGAFTLQQPYISDHKLFAAVREAFGWNLEIEIVRHKAPKPEHPGFERERYLMSNLLVNYVESSRNTRIVPDSDFYQSESVYREDVIEFFDSAHGEGFLDLFRKKKPLTDNLPKTGLFISSVEYCTAMVVKTEVFDCVKEGIDFVRETADRNHMGVKVIVENTNTGLIRVTMTGKDKLSVDKVGSVIGKVVQPEIIRGMDEGSSKKGETGSHGHLSMSSRKDAFLFMRSCGGQAFMKNKIEPIYDVKCVIHPVDETMHIHGPPDNKFNAKMKLLHYIEDLVQPVSIRSEGDTKMPAFLVQKLLRQRFGNDLDGLRHKTGVTSACWGSKKGCLTVWGNSESVEKVKEIIKEMQTQMSSISKSSNKSGQNCVGCFSPVNGFPFRTSLCGHVFCTECIELHIRVALKDKSLPIRCVAEGCTEPLLVDDIGRACEYRSHDLKQLLDASVSFYIARGGKQSPVHHCPTPDCEGLYMVSTDEYQGQQCQCQLCGSSLCNLCHMSPYHEGYTCALWKKRELLDKDTATWFSENAELRRFCGRCGMGIEKIDGCYNVTCANCKHAVCFKCSETFETASDCYSHLDEAHGGAF